MLKAAQLILAVKHRAEIDQPLLKQSLNAVSHSHNLSDGSRGNSLKTAADDPRKRCVYRRRRTARLTDYNIAVKFFLIHDRSFLVHLSVLRLSPT